MDKLLIAKKAVANLRQAAAYKAMVKRGMLSQGDCDILIAEGNRQLEELKSQGEVDLSTGKAAPKK
jgi:hypothetical protein